MRMTQIRISAADLGALLALPDGAKTYEVQYNDANKLYEFTADAPGWPEGCLELIVDREAAAVTGHREL